MIHDKTHEAIIGAQVKHRTQRQALRHTLSTVAAVTIFRYCLLLLPEILQLKRYLYNDVICRGNAGHLNKLTVSCKIVPDSVDSNMRSKDLRHDGVIKFYVMVDKMHMMISI